jgi:hypothetical protein
MHNENSDDYSQLDIATDRLATQTAARESLIKKQYEDMELVRNLDHRVIDLLAESGEVLQRDFGKLFDISIREDVRNVLYQMEKCGALKRIPDGKTYSLPCRMAVKHIWPVCENLPKKSWMSWSCSRTVRDFDLSSQTMSAGHALSTFIYKSPYIASTTKA